ncbi:MAG: UPF0236 family protein [Bacteroidota bacterium]
MRKLCCLVGQATVYSQASELLEQVGGIEIPGMQIQRICTYYGSLIDPLVKADVDPFIPKPVQKDKQDPLYIMVDGAMLFTREDKWRELKLGRVFAGSQVVNLTDTRRIARQSLYVSHLGSVDGFFPKLERHLVGFHRKVIIGDGAKWIWKWADDNYPGAKQILDFYHAKEKLVLFGRHQWKCDQVRRNWVKEQSDSLLNNELEKVLSQVKSIRASNPEAKRAKEKLLTYYVEHDDRMQYKTYREQGLMIGSGPIEAAHRSVIQQRMKLSGQKWSIKGAQAMANLRCYKCSGAWNIIENIVEAA